MPFQLGLLNVHKEAGVTSRDIVNRVQRVIRPMKVGHAGTLDPMATGILLLCIGRATRLISTIQELPKEYIGEFRLGIRSDTDDITGELQISTCDGWPSKPEVQQLLPQFQGCIEQVPPQYSAVHVDGQRAYKRARAGEAIDIPARMVAVYELELTRFVPPDLTLRIRCSSGTYIRSIGRDIGERLGCGAVMTSLVRTAIGPFSIDEAVPSEWMQGADENRIANCLLPLKMAVRHLPGLVVDDRSRLDLTHGRMIDCPPHLQDELTVAVFDAADELVCLALPDSSERLKPKTVFASPD